MFSFDIFLWKLVQQKYFITSLDIQSPSSSHTECEVFERVIDLPFVTSGPLRKFHVFPVNRIMAASPPQWTHRPCATSGHDTSQPFVGSPSALERPVVAVVEDW